MIIKITKSSYICNSMTVSAEGRSNNLGHAVLYTDLQNNMLFFPCLIIRTESILSEQNTIQYIRTQCRKQQMTIPNATANFKIFLKENIWLCGNFRVKCINNQQKITERFGSH